MFASRTSLAVAVAATTFAVGGAIAVAAPDLAPPTTSPAEHDHSAHSHPEEAADPRLVTGTADSGETKLSKPTRTRAGRSTGHRVGLLTYRSQSGNLCFVAGPVKGEKVGRLDKKGAFTPVDPAEAPGVCGEFDENIAEFGGVAMGSSSSSEEDPAQPQAVVYGLVEKSNTTVTVTTADGTTLPAEVDKLSGLGKAPAAYSVALPVGVSVQGTIVTLTSPAGAVLHTFQL